MNPERLKRHAPCQSLDESWRKRQRISPPASPTLSPRCYNPFQAQPAALSQCLPRNNRKSLSHDDYTIGWICALEVELAAAEAMLDEIHPTLPRVGSDPNAYNLGRIGRHNIVITCLPTGGMGTNSAATAAANLLRSFPKVRFGLMVGIGGGVPGVPSDDPEEDIRLGDIVVSKPTDSLGGVIQYDFGKATMENELQRTGWLNAPPHELRTGVLKLQARHRREGSLTSHFLAEMLDRYPRMAKEFRHQGAEQDRLFHADYAHEENEKECTSCDPTQAVMRKQRENNDPVIHYGLIGSANRVVKSGTVRERLRQEMKILCVEMEAAGLMNNFPCLVVRGIADYADTHKNKRWQPYAAATAAAYTKELLQVIPAVDVECMTEAAKLPGILREEFDNVNAKLDSLIQVARRSSDNTDLAQQFRTESVSQMQRMEDKLEQLVDYMEESRSVPPPLKILFRKIRRSGDSRKESHRGDMGDPVAEIHNWQHIITPGTKIIMDITFRRGKTSQKHTCPWCHAVHSETVPQNKRVTCHNCRLDFNIEEANRVVELPDDDNHTIPKRSRDGQSTVFQGSRQETIPGKSYIYQGTPSLAGSSIMSTPSNAIAPTTDAESHGSSNAIACDNILSELFKGVDMTSFSNLMESCLHHPLSHTEPAPGPELAFNVQATNRYEAEDWPLGAPASESESTHSVSTTANALTSNTQLENAFASFNHNFFDVITDDVLNNILAEMSSSTAGPWSEDPFTDTASLSGASLPLDEKPVTYPGEVPSDVLTENEVHRSTQIRRGGPT